MTTLTQLMTMHPIAACITIYLLGLWLYLYLLHRSIQRDKSKAEAKQMWGDLESCDLYAKWAGDPIPDEELERLNREKWQD